MTLEQQCVSFELAKRLKGLGVKQESVFWWVEYTDGHGEKEMWHVQHNHTGYKQYFSAFTVAELGSILELNHANCCYCHTDKGWLVQWYDDYGNGVDKCTDTEADARAKMLIYLIENKLIKSL